MLKVGGDRGTGIRLPRRTVQISSAGHRDVPAASRAGEDERISTCIVAGCGSAIAPNDKVARFKIGRVVYSDSSGYKFEAENFWDKRSAVYAHLLCAHKAKVLDSYKLPMLELDYDWCRLCNSQFYCEVEPRELAILVDTGHLYETRKSLITRFQSDYEGGCVHWPCALEAWSEALVRRLVPLVDPIAL